MNREPLWAERGINKQARNSQRNAKHEGISKIHYVENSFEKSIAVF